MDVCICGEITTVFQVCELLSLQVHLLHGMIAMIIVDIIVRYSSCLVVVRMIIGVMG